MVNDLYNRSKIVLNIQCLQSKNGWSSRLAEISGSGAFQIVDFNQYIYEELGNNMVTYTDYKDLKNKLVHYLNNESKIIEMKQKEHECMKNYTYKNQIRYVLSKF